ncbi:MAG: hypothetical protein ACYTGR_08805 [Planctomycetota bacterium]|jgi:hypothetical protein
MLDKKTLITHIQSINRSARPEWLDRFTTPDLRQYLDHLQHAQEPRGATSRWARSSGAAASTRRPMH